MVNLAWLLDVAANFDVEAGSNAPASGVKRDLRRQIVPLVMNLCFKLHKTDCKKFSRNFSTDSALSENV